ncbi:hypothetical protein SDC9_167534 [bioreactor metagenome]|uniref:Uncharacterized protein n=1 Tax=bioreactor metagenome TaxID=1076179 RepID=A0A645G010_9ZZZZ
MFHVEKIMFHAADSFFRKSLIDLRHETKVVKEEQYYEKTLYEHTAHTVHGADLAANDCGSADGRKTLQRRRCYMDWHNGRV